MTKFKFIILIITLFLTNKCYSQIEPTELSINLKNNNVFFFGDTLTTKWKVSPTLIFIEQTSGIFSGVSGVAEVNKPRLIEADIFIGWLGNICNNYKMTFYGGYDRIGTYDLIFSNLAITIPDTNSNLFGKMGFGFIYQHPFNLKPEDSIGLYKLDGIYLRFSWNDPYDTELNQWKTKILFG